MSEITLDAATAERLKTAESLTTLRGPDGQVVGGAVPAELITAVRLWLEQRERLLEDDDHVTVEELRAIEAAGGEIPHDEVMKRLGLE